MANAISAAAFNATLGINTHIDFNAYGYQNLATVESNINYLGVKIIRDSAQTASDAQSWLQVAQATGAKFDDYIAENSPAGMQTDLGFVQQLAQEGILSAVEGGDEEDDSYPASLGNTTAVTAAFQLQLYALGRQLGLPVINMSFGAGWTYTNNWEGDYGTVGDLSAYATYGNAHTYPNAGQLPDASILRMNGLAEMAASTRPVMTTEIGWSTSTFDETTIAKYVLDAAMDGIKDGDAGMYFYGLYDDGSGNWGLFNANGTPRPAATALHDLTTLLSDTGATAATFKPGSLNYSLSGNETGDSSVVIEKSNGSFWLALWNETEAANSPHTITVNLGTQAATVTEYDPLTGTSSIKTWTNVSSIQVSVPDHPVLLEIVPSTTGGSSGGGSSGGGSSGGGTPTGPTFTLPGGETTTTGSTIAITGASVTDAFAAGNPGTLALNVSASTGLVAMTAGGTRLPGSGTHAMSVTGTLAQINADLATLTYTAGGGAGTDWIIVDVWDQAGIEGDKGIAVTVTAPKSAGPTIAAPASDSVTTGSTTTITGISVTDAFAASNPGTMALNVGASTGLIAMTAGGSRLPGSGTHAMSVTGTLAQINADLATLSYTASSVGTDAISVNVWDQAGLDSTSSIGVIVSPEPTIAIAASNANPTELLSNTIITASAGNHMIFVGGTGDTVTATGGTETVQAFQGGNKIATGAANDTISFAGSGNTINAGAGSNVLQDSGSGNTIVMPGAAQGFDDVFGYVLLNGDALDFRAALAETSWNGSQATLGNFLHVTTSGASAIISLSDTSSGAAAQIANLEGAGQVTLSGLLAHSVT